MSAGQPRKDARKAIPIWAFAASVAICAAVAAVILVKQNRGVRPTAQVVPASAPETTPKTNSTTANPSQPPPTAADLENQAVTLMAEGKVEEALAYLNRAVKLSPDDETTHFNLAYAYARADRKQDAIKEYEEALKLFPDYAEAHNNLGNLLMDQKKYDEAVGHFSQAIKLSPDNANSLNNLGKALILQGKSKESLSFFSEAVRINPAYVEARCNYGNALLANRKPSEALAEFQEALKLAPDFPPAKIGAARSRQAMNTLNQ